MDLNISDEMLPFFAAKYIHDENEELRSQAEKAWELIIEKSKEIEAEAAREELVIPADAKSGQEMLEELMKRVGELKNESE